MTIKYDNYTPKDPSSTGRIFFRDYEDERTDASAGVGVSYPSGIVSVGLTGNEQNVVDGVSSIIPPVTGTGSNSSLKLFTPDDIIAFVAAHETGGGGGGNTWSDPVSSNILPSLANDVAFTLGDSDQRFKEIWVSGIHTFSSIDLRGQVFENVGPTSSTLSGVSTAERNAGEETDFRLFSPADISSMALQHGPAAGSITEGDLEDLIAGLDASSIQSNDEFLFRVSSGTDELAVTTASGIVDKGLTDLGIDPQNRITDTRDPNVDDDGAGTNGVIHIINDLWTNTSTDEAFICLDITTNAAVWSSITAAGGGGGGGNEWSDPVSSNIVPDADGTHDLGADATRFAQAYIDELHSTGGLLVTESADHTNTPAAGKGEFWVRNDTPNKPIFTDDDGVDHDLTVGEWFNFHSISPTTTSADRNAFLIVPYDCTVKEIRWAGFRSVGVDAANYWTIMPKRRDPGGDVDLLDAAFSTSGGINEDTSYDLGTITTNGTDAQLSKGDVLLVTFTAVGTPPSWFGSDHAWAIHLEPR